MAALLTAQFYSPARLVMVDVDDSRLAMSKKFGATDVINSASSDAAAELMAMTKDGVDVVIEAVGIPETFDICQSVVRPGGHIANVGVHGTSVDLQLQDLWIKNITLTTGLVNTNTTPMLMKTLESGKLTPAELITHRFDFKDFMQAYEVFSNASKEKALKIIVDNS
jgi:alcohol dehydrogenase